jgi:hypothetical protein
MTLAMAAKRSGDVMPSVVAVVYCVVSHGAW